jgi:hypothetical protein
MRERKGAEVVYRRIRSSSGISGSLINCCIIDRSTGDYEDIVLCDLIQNIWYRMPGSM